jgi:hypothetical protein
MLSTCQQVCGATNMASTGTRGRSVHSGSTLAKHTIRGPSVALSGMHRASLIQLDLNERHTLAKHGLSRQDRIRLFARMTNGPGTLGSSPGRPRTAPEGPGHDGAVVYVPRWTQHVNKHMASAPLLRLEQLLLLIDSLRAAHAIQAAAAERLGRRTCSLPQAVLQHYELRFGPIERSAVCASRLATLVVSVHHHHAGAVETVRAFGAAMGILLPSDTSRPVPTACGPAMPNLG